MESESCKTLNFNGIREVIKQGIIIMSAIKKAAFGLSVLFATMGTANNAEAQQFARNDNAPTKPKTELAGTFADKTKANPEANPLAPAIRQGHYGEAEGHSIKHNMMVVQISGPNVEKLKTEAREIHEAFKNAEIPMDIVVFYQEQKDIPKTLGSVAMNGTSFRLPSGARNFDVPTLKKYADTFIKYYLKHHAPLAQANAPVNFGESLATNQPE
jgi:hypothetical protein